MRGRRIAALLAMGGAALAFRAVGRRTRSIELDGRRAFVTGGSRGLGFALARELAREGCRVAICARDAGELDRARAELAAEGLDIETVTCDVASAAEVDRAIAEVRQRLGGIDILVNNAGIIQVGPVEAMTLDDYRQAMDVMYWGIVHTTLAVLPEMRERGDGSIVNVTSIGGKIAVPHLLPYGAAKFAAVGFSEGLHAEVARDGVRVTTVVPGLMRTGSFLEAWFKGDQRREYAWFSVASSAPLVTIEASRAARKIVDAIRQGRTELVLTPPAKAAVRVQGLMPATTTRVLTAVDRVLPHGRGDGPIKGAEAEERVGSRLQRGLTRFGREAARRYQR
ncbi:MAG: SDR family NAD(P)-dependent oxidoreductase [Thermoanaerobaculia bacterium]